MFLRDTFFRGFTKRRSGSKQTYFSSCKVSEGEEHKDGFDKFYHSFRSDPVLFTERGRIFLNYRPGPVEVLGENYYAKSEEGTRCIVKNNNFEKIDNFGYRRRMTPEEVEYFIDEIQRSGYDIEEQTNESDCVALAVVKK